MELHLRLGGGIPIGLSRSGLCPWLFAAWTLAAPGALADTKTYSFAGASAPSRTHVAMAFQVDVSDPEDPPSANDIDTLTSDGTSSGTPDLRTGIAGYSNAAEATSNEYAALGSSDDSRWEISAGSGLHACFWARFAVGLDPSTITRIEVALEGHQASASKKAWLGIWRPGASIPYWHLLEASQATGDRDYGGALTTDLDEYLDGNGDLHIIFFDGTEGDTLSIDDVEIEVERTCGDGRFKYRRSLTIDHEKVGVDDDGSLPETGFPVLVALDAQSAGNWLKNANWTGGRIRSPKGWDIIFRDADGKTLSHEIETYDGAAGILVAWVRIDSLSKSADTTISIYYGNDCIDGPTEDPASVWDSSYALVQHMEESELPLYDSTSNANDATSAAGDPTYGAAGKIAEGVSFDGSDDQLDIPNDASLVIGGDVAISVWAYRETETTIDYFVDFAQSGETEAGNHQYEFYIGADDRLYLEWEYGAGTNVVIASSVAVSQPSGTWAYYAVVRDTTSKSVIFYENGTPLGSAQSYAQDATGGADGYLTIGFPSSGNTGRFDGVLDEIRISSAMRDADWIRTSYNNQSDPSSFYELGEEEGPGAPTAIAIARFVAERRDEGILLAWETAQEIGNAGFRLHRSPGREGPFAPISEELIPGSPFSLAPREYRFLDRGAAAGARPFYLLEAIDIFSNRTYHGPIRAGGEDAPGDPVRFARGDANGDGRFDLSDAIAILAQGAIGASPPCAKAADLDDDGDVDLDDALAALRHLFLGGPAPKAPFPGCGSDATPDPLSCDAPGCAE